MCIYTHTYIHISLKNFRDHKWLIEIETHSEARKLEIVSSLVYLPRPKLRALFLLQCMMASLTPKAAQGVNYSSHPLHPPLCFRCLWFHQLSQEKHRTMNSSLGRWRDFKLHFKNQAHMVLAYAWQTFSNSHFHALHPSSCAQLCETTSVSGIMASHPQYCKQYTFQVGKTQLHKSLSLFFFFPFGLPQPKMFAIKKAIFEFLSHVKHYGYKGWLFHSSH